MLYISLTKLGSSQLLYQNVRRLFRNIFAVKCQLTFLLIHIEKPVFRVALGISSPSAFPSPLSALTELLLGWSELVWASLGHVLGVGGEAEVSGRFGLHKVSYPFASGTQRDPPQLLLFLPIRPTLSNPRLSMIGHR